MDQDNNTTRKPTVRPTAYTARSSTLSQSAGTSAARSGSSLTRPTASTLRRATATTTSRSSTPTHRATAYTTSVGSKATEDVINKDEISARTKRLSAATNLSSVRPSSRLTTAATNQRSSTSTTTRGIGSTPSTEASASKPSTTSSRTTNPLTSRPTPESTIRSSVSSVSDRSTASTTNKQSKTSRDDAANPISPPRLRPPLGGRKSTRSILMSSRINELETIQQLFSAALSNDAQDADQRRSLQDEAAAMLEKLKSSTIKIKDFETEHGRPPSEEEVAAIEAIDIDFDVSSPAETRQSRSERRLLEEELAQSQTQVRQLEARLTDLTEKLEQFGTDVGDESEKVNEAAEAARTELANKVRDMSSTNQARLDHLRMVHREELAELRTQHEEHIAELSKTQDDEIEKRVTELQELQEQVEILHEQVSHAEALRTEVEQLKVSLSDTRDEKAELNGRVRELKSSARSTHEGQPAPTVNVDLTDDNHDVGLQELRQRYATLENEAGAQKEQARQRLIELQANNDVRVTQLEKQHSQAMAERQDEIHILQSSLQARQQEHTALQQSNAAELEQLTKDIEAQTMALARAQQLQEELIWTKTQLERSTRSVEALKKDLATLHRDTEKSKDQLSKDIRDLQHKNDDKDAEIGKQSDTVRQLEQLIHFKNEKHERALDELNTTHSARLKQLEEDGMSSLASLEAIEAEHTARIEKLKEGHEQAKSHEMSQLRETHATELSQLEDKMTQMQEELEQASKSHNLDIDQLRSTHEASQKRSLRALADEHAQEVAELQEQLDATSKSNQIEAEQNHQKQISDLEAQVNILESRLQHATSQTQIMRGVMRSNEEESRARIKELESEVEKAEGQFNQAVMRISQHSFQMSEVVSNHAQAIVELKADHDAAMQALVEKSEMENRDVLENHKLELAQREKDLVNGHQDAVASLQEKLDGSVQEHSAAMTSLKAGHEKHLAEIDDKHASELSSARALLEAEKEERSRDKNQYSSGMEKQISKHEAEILEVAQQYNTVVDELRAKVRDGEEVLRNTQRDSDNKVSRLQAEHETTKQRLEQKSQQFQKDAIASVETQDRLRSELDALRATLRGQVEQHDSRMSALVEAHKTELQSMQGASQAIQTASNNDDLQNLRSAVGEAQATIKTLEGQLTETRNDMGVLNTEYGRAVDDAEQQRKRVLQLESEIRRHTHAATMKIESSPNLMSPATKARTATNGVKSAPRAGLTSSKWANEVRAEDTNGVGIDTNVEAESSPSSPVRRSSVHGQLASINEDIRSLNDLSELMLMQNRSLATTLSKVDEHTGVVNGMR